MKIAINVVRTEIEKANPSREGDAKPRNSLSQPGRRTFIENAAVFSAVPCSGRIGGTVRERRPLDARLRIAAHRRVAIVAAGSCALAITVSLGTVASALGGGQWGGGGTAVRGPLATQTASPSPQAGGQSSSGGAVVSGPLAMPAASPSPQPSGQSAGGGAVVSGPLATQTASPSTVAGGQRGGGTVCHP